MATEIMVDDKTGVRFIAETELENPSMVMEEIMKQVPELAALSTWTSSISNRRAGSIYDRDEFSPTPYIFEQFQQANQACRIDDVVSGVMEATEALALNNFQIECEDEDEQDIWNQIMKDLKMAVHFKEMWRELFKVSQFYCAVLWGTKSYKVSGTTRKKVFNNLKVPIGITILDPLKVLPVGNFMFGQERLVYIADKTEAINFDQVLAGTNTTDLIVSSLLEGKYQSTKDERKSLQQELGQKINLENMYYLRSDSVFRHTLTRASYERFADCRLISIFELLDLKKQLRNDDRTHLLASTNFIVLVKKGDKDRPPTSGQLQNLASQFRVVNKVPIIVGDDTLHVEIITPKVEQVLKPERHNMIDARISSRLYQILSGGNYSSGTANDDSIKLSRVIGKGLESRRNSLGESFSEHVLYETFKKNAQLTTKPCLIWTPERIALDFDPNYANFILDMRDRGDLSREFSMQMVGASQEVEARRRKREEKNYDDIFVPPDNVPFDGPQGQPTGQEPQPKNPKAVGRKGGGRTNGGGQNSASGVSQPGRGYSN